MLSYNKMDFLLIFILGLIWGSFANVCIYRIPKGESIIFPPSHCPFCKSKIAFYDNIPIISYLILKGKCRNCKEKISIIYPVVEFLSGVISILSYIKGGFTFISIYFFFTSFIFLILTFIDLKDKILPDSLTFGGIFFAFFYSIVFKINPPVFERLAGAALSSFLFLFLLLIFFIIKGFYGLGYGDVKLIAFVGIVFGFPDFLKIIIGSSIFIILIYIPVYFLKRKRWIIPYGAFLSFFSIIYLFYK